MPLLSRSRLGGTRASSALAGWLERVRLTVAGGLMLSLAVAGWYGARRTGSRTIYLLAYATVVVVVMSLLVSRRRLSLSVDRSALPARARAGQTIDVQLSIRTQRRVSTVVVEEHLHDRLGRSVHLPIATLAPGQDLDHSYQLRPTQRGVYAVGPTTATWSDPFGLTTRRQQIAPEVPMIVHPPVEQVHDRILTRMWEDPPIRPPVSKPWPTGFEFYGMRDYVPGDDLRRVVWSVVARTGKMMVRESEQGITDRVVLVVDNNRGRHSPGDPSLTFETGIRVAASLAVKHLDDGFSVTLLPTDGPVLSALRGSRARMQLLDELARLGLGSGTLVDVAPQLMAAARAGAHFVVVTPHLDAEGATQLRLILERGVSVVVAKTVWDETDPVSADRAASLGCQVVQVAPGVSLNAVFQHQVGAGVRR